jgi:hypothetical protein
VTLEAYVRVCRAIVRTAGSTRRLDQVLEVYALDRGSWSRITAGWTRRIRKHEAVHAEFGRLYAAGASDAPSIE